MLLPHDKRAHRGGPSLIPLSVLSRVFLVQLLLLQVCAGHPIQRQARSTATSHHLKRLSGMPRHFRPSVISMTPRQRVMAEKQEVERVDVPQKKSTHNIDFHKETSSMAGAYAGTIGMMAFTNIEGYQGEIFCNRNTNMEKISAVGFDMDYTLALYRPDTFEKLVFKESLKRLVNKKGYPELILSFEYDPTYFVRGLHVDKKRGNILKLDRHKYVKVAYHGFRKLSKDERAELYFSAADTNDFTEPEFQCLDTLFSLPEAYLYSQMVTIKDSSENLQDKSYFEIWKDVRQSVDACHWSHEFLKREVAKDPAPYVVRDPHLFESLRHLKRSGRKVFLLTNSFWEYTNVVMNYLWGNPPGTLTDEWQDVFDVVIAGSCKPGFFVNNRLALYRVRDPESSPTLTFVEGLQDLTSKELLREGKVFQGGNWEILHKMLDVKSGSEILYVGDHMYSDVIRSKRDLGWRTMMVIPELLHEIDRMESPLAQREYQSIKELYFQRATQEDHINELSVKLEEMEEQKMEEEEGGATQEDYRDALRIVNEQLVSTKAELRERVKTYHEMFHPVWGQLFKTGLQNSIFAQHVEKYACLYTSHASNFRFVSPSCNFRSMADLLPHDGLRRAVPNPNSRDRSVEPPPI
mmetsp:Transcript_9132/g.22406  ORF Transcript_9132/g.22406 Transcript_9132/m.22406 type:complete len:634 (+) Transcript_9132:93-1994(+)